MEIIYKNSYQELQTTDKKIIDIMENCPFKLGDSVRLKNDKTNPIMIVSFINVQTQTIIYDKVYNLVCIVSCVRFSKVRQEYLKDSFNVELLEKADEIRNI